jgi:hypothetical protein
MELRRLASLVYSFLQTPLRSDTIAIVTRGCPARSCHLGRYPPTEDFHLISSRPCREHTNRLICQTDARGIFRESGV